MFFEIRAFREHNNKSEENVTATIRNWKKSEVI